MRWAERAARRREREQRGVCSMVRGWPPRPARVRRARRAFRGASRRRPTRGSCIGRAALPRPAAEVGFGWCRAEALRGRASRREEADEASVAEIEISEASVAEIEISCLAGARACERPCSIPQQ